MHTAKILVADDEQNLRRVLVAMLRRDGHEVVQAASGGEAIEQLADVDVVITDLRMPEVDGLQVLREARRKEPPPEVIVMTAYGTAESAVEAPGAGYRGVGRCLAFLTLASSQRSSSHSTWSALSRAR